MKKKIIVLISFLAIMFIIVALSSCMHFNNSNNVEDLLYEKYGENFKITHDYGNEYKGLLFPTFQKTGYKNVIASPTSNEEIKFNVRLKISPSEIDKDGYIPANIAYNTAKMIEKNYKIGAEMYVHISASEYESDGKKTDNFFDSKNGKGSIVISVYVEGLDNKFDCVEYLNKIIKDLNFDSNTTGIIRLYLIKENGIEKIKNYYKNNKDMVKAENCGDLDFRTKYFETPNKDYFISF